MPSMPGERHDALRPIRGWLRANRRGSHRDTATAMPRARAAPRLGAVAYRPAGVIVTGDLTPIIAVSVSVATLALALLTAWVKLNDKGTKLEIAAAKDKGQCDSSLLLLRAEIVAVERRAELGIQGVVGQLKPQLTRIEERLDRFLEMRGPQ